LKEGGFTEFGLETALGISLHSCAILIMFLLRLVIVFANEVMTTVKERVLAATKEVKMTTAGKR